MTGREIIESGLVELYCLGLLSGDLQLLLESHLSTDEAVRLESQKIYEALAAYGSRFETAIKPGLKSKLFSKLDGFNVEPPLLSPGSSVEEWMFYLEVLEMKPPHQMDELIMLPIASTGSHSNFVLWGNPGNILAEETHDELVEHVLVCRGGCEMLIDGKESTYGEGDYMRIEPRHHHSGIITSGSPAIMIVQRRAA